MYKGEKTHSKEELGFPLLCNMYKYVEITGNMYKFYVRKNFVFQVCKNIIMKIFSSTGIPEEAK